MTGVGSSSVMCRRLSMSTFGHDLIEHAAICDMDLRRGRPAAEIMLDGEELERVELPDITLRDARITWAIEIARLDILGLRCVEKPEVGLGLLSRPVRVDILVDDRDRG